MELNRTVVRNGPFKRIIADGVKVGDVIYLSGQVSVSSEGETIGVGDLAEQLRHAYGNVSRVLASFGAGMEHVIDETLFVMDVDAFLDSADELFAIRAEMFNGDPKISQTLVQVARLGSAQWLVEVKCIAVAP